MAADEVDEKSIESTGDTSAKQYELASDQLKSSYTARVEELGTELEQRVSDYMEEKARDTSSWGVLKDLRLSIVDGGVSILRKPAESADASESKTSAATDLTASMLQAPENPIEAQIKKKDPDSGPAAEAPTADKPSTGSVVVTDDHGNPTVIVTGNDKTTTVEYESNKPKAIHLDDGSTLSRKSDGTWERSFSGVGTVESYSDVAVAKDGTITCKLKDGSTEKRNTDGSIVNTNENGDVTRVISPNGFVSHNKYVGRELVEFQLKDGLRFKKEGGDWVCRDGEPPKEISRFKGDVSFTPEGHRIIRSEDGSTTVKRDGSGIETFRDKSSVTWDTNGRVTDITHPDGTKTHVTYDGDGPVEIRDPDGSTWKHEGSRWYQYKNGKPTGDSWVGDMDVTSDGDVVRKTPSGDEVATRHRNGEQTTELRQETKDKSGHVTEIAYPGRDGGEPVLFKYTNGKLSEAHAGDGSTYKRMADGRWQEYQGDAPVGSPQEIELRTNEHGDCTISTKNGQPLQIKHRDGSQTTFHPDGTKEWEKIKRTN